MISFDDLAVKARAHNPESDTDLLHRAYEFSAVEHAGQRRRSGEEYITHPLICSTARWPASSRI